MQRVPRSGSAYGWSSLLFLVIALALTSRGMASTLDPPLATAAQPMTIVLDERTPPPT